jgi:hypothetical protein
MRLADIDLRSRLERIFKKERDRHVKKAAICCNRLAPMRVVPFSCFCTCWKVTPIPFPGSVWLIDNILRRMRTRRPASLSMGFGDFLAS